MREIKFRAWFKGNSEQEPRMLYPTAKRYELGLAGINWTEGGFVIDSIKGSYSFDRVELMQSTGSKDKNGREIYEGDIVKTPDDVGSIQWSQERMQWMIRFSEKLSDELCDYRQHLHPELIGNIYEKPELLK